MLIRLSHSPTTSSMLSICANWGWSWLSMCLSEMICRPRARCRNSSACFRTKLPVRTTLNVPYGAMDSFASIAGHPASRGMFSLALVCCVAGDVAVTRASLQAPSWNAHTHRSRCGSGQPTWSPARRPVCRPVPAATRTAALRDCFPDSSQTTGRHGPPRPGSDWRQLLRFRRSR